MDKTNRKNKWTLMKYIKEFSLMTEYAKTIRDSHYDVDVAGLSKLNNKMIQRSIYNPRFGKASSDTTNFKVCQIVYYMFAYRSADKKNIIFSPLGNLLLDNLDDKAKVAKIFTSMLFGMPFNHPYNKMDSSFNIFPFRLVFKLLCDDRLSGILNNDEVFYITAFSKEINEQSYEKLVNDILNFRKKSYHSKYDMFKASDELEDTIANALHEWAYVCGHLKGAGIIDYYESNEKIGVLVHGRGRGGGCSGRRSYTPNYCKLKPSMKSFVQKMLNAYAFDEKPHDMLEHLGKSDYILHLYNFYPTILLDELGLTSHSRINAVLQLSEDIKRYSKNKEAGDCYRFETVLCDAFNEFNDVSAEKIAKAGTTDVECIYLTIDEKFDLEAKSTGKKLSAINKGRLEEHQNLIGSKYTIVVAPCFMPSVLFDIKKSKIVVITASSLSNFLYQSAIHNGNEMSYKPLYDIVTSSFSEDISSKVNKYVSETYGLRLNAIPKDIPSKNALQQ